MKKNLAPVVLFVYNRLDKAIQTIQLLRSNDLARNTVLYIFSDGPKPRDKKRVAELRNYLKNVSGFKKVILIKRKKNLGLSKSIISGVTSVLEKTPRVIVLEDDIIISNKFLEYMNSALDFYESYPTVFSISGYNPTFNNKTFNEYKFDVYFNPVSSSWGWATWKDKWAKASWKGLDYSKFVESKYLQEKFDRMGSWLSKMLKSQLDGEIDSWAIRWTFTHFKYNAYAVFPLESLVNNIGFDGSGVHCKGGSSLQVQKLSSKLIYRFPTFVFEEPKFLEEYRKAYASGITVTKIKSKMRKYFSKLVKN